MTASNINAVRSISSSRSNCASKSSFREELSVSFASLIFSSPSRIVWLASSSRAETSLIIESKSCKSCEIDSICMLSSWDDRFVIVPFKTISRYFVSVSFARANHNSETRSSKFCQAVPMKLTLICSETCWVMARTVVRTRVALSRLAESIYTKMFPPMPASILSSSRSSKTRTAEYCPLSSAKIPSTAQSGLNDWTFTLSDSLTSASIKVVEMFPGS